MVLGVKSPAFSLSNAAKLGTRNLEWCDVVAVDL